MEYADSVIWDHHTINNIRKLKMVQRRTARLVFVDFHTTSNVTATMNALDPPVKAWSLHERWAQAKLGMMYCIVNLQDDVSMMYITTTEAYMQEHNKRFLISYARISVRQISFFPDRIRLWNIQSRQLVEHFLKIFKEEVQQVQLRYSLQEECF